MAENEKLAQSLQVDMQEAEQLHAAAQNAVSAWVYLEEMIEMILIKVSTFGETMWNLHEEFVTVHKAVVHLNGLQQQSKDFVKTLKNV